MPSAVQLTKPVLNLQYFIADTYLSAVAPDWVRGIASEFLVRWLTCHWQLSTVPWPASPVLLAWQAQTSRQHASTVAPFPLPAEGHLCRHRHTLPVHINHNSLGLDAGHCPRVALCAVCKSFDHLQQQHQSKAKHAPVTVNKSDWVLL